jgi:hypothetical protein
MFLRERRDGLISLWNKNRNSFIQLSFRTCHAYVTVAHETCIANNLVKKRQLWICCHLHQQAGTTHKHTHARARAMTQWGLLRHTWPTSSWGKGRALPLVGAAPERERRNRDMWRHSSRSIRRVRHVTSLAAWAWIDVSSDANNYGISRKVFKTTGKLLRQ